MWPREPKVKSNPPPANIKTIAFGVLARNICIYRWNLYQSWAIEPPYNPSAHTPPGLLSLSLQKDAFIYISLPRGFSFRDMCGSTLLMSRVETLGVAALPPDSPIEYTRLNSAASANPRQSQTWLMTPIRTWGVPLIANTAGDTVLALINPPRRRWPTSKDVFSLWILFFL